MKCGFIWGCPICSPILMKKHGEDLTIGLYSLQAMGGTRLLITGTIPHKSTDDMLALMKDMDIARKLYGKGGTLSRTLKSLGYIGSITRLEVTFGDNGIHPHTHTILAFKRQLTCEELKSLSNYLRDKWKQSCIEAGLVTKKNERNFDTYGFHCDSCSNVEKMIWYMTKMEKGKKNKNDKTSGLAKEMTNASDAKRGRGIGGDHGVENEKAQWGRSQWDVMRGFINGDKEDTNLWLTFLKAFHRKSAISWSPGLKKALGITDEKDREGGHGVKIDEEELEFII